MAHWDPGLCTDWDPPLIGPAQSQNETFELKPVVDIETCPINKLTYIYGPWFCTLVIFMMGQPIHGKINCLFCKVFVTFPQFICNGFNITVLRRIIRYILTLWQYINFIKIRSWVAPPYFSDMSRDTSEKKGAIQDLILTCLIDYTHVHCICLQLIYHNDVFTYDHDHPNLDIFLSFMTNFKK